MCINHPEISHEFDVWHLSKNVMKTLKILEKKYSDVYNIHEWTDKNGIIKKYERKKLTDE